MAGFRWKGYVIVGKDERGELLVTAEDPRQVTAITDPADEDSSASVGGGAPLHPDDLGQPLAGKAPTDLVFGSRVGTPLRVQNFRRDWFDRAADAVGPSGLTPHELRHTPASLAIASGASVKGAQSMLGHASAQMTLDRYGHLFPDELDAVADHLDAASC